MLPLSFFTDNIGKTLKRSRKDKITDEVFTSYVHVKDERAAQYYHDLQDEYISFEKNNPRRIHIGDNTCISCEG